MDEDTQRTAGDTRTEPGPQQHPTSYAAGPRVTGPQVRDLNQLRRSSTDRYLGGVAGGIGRHLDIDPTVVRVALVVLTLFGGAGLLLYVALWLFVPSDTSRRAPMRIKPEWQSAFVITAIVVAGLVFLGNGFGDNGFNVGFPLAVVLIIAAVVYLAVRDRQDTRERAATQAGQPQGAPLQEGTTMSSTTHSPPVGPPVGAPGSAYPQEGAATTPPPPAWMPPQPPAYVPPPRPRRTGLVLFWPTLALIAISLGTLGIVDASSSVPVSAYAALAVAVTGVMLLVGAFVGRPGGLIALGLLASFVMVVSSLAVAATGGVTESRDLTAAPTTAAEVRGSYSVPTGSIDLDLTGITDLASLDGTDIDVHLNAGDITVTLPAGVRAQVDADIRYAGDITLGGSNSGGFNQAMSRTLDSGAGADAPSITLHVRARVGQITVTQN